MELISDDPHNVVIGPDVKRQGVVEWCLGPLRFQTASPSGDLKRIALASAPGSGNTWLRYLIQQATGERGNNILREQGVQKVERSLRRRFNG